MVTIEGVVVKKEKLSFVDFISVKENDQLDANNIIVVKPCIYCGEQGHGEVNCWVKKVDKSDKSNGIRSTVCHVKIPERMCLCALNLRQLKIMYRAVSTSSIMRRRNLVVIRLIMRTLMGRNVVVIWYVCMFDLQ